MNFYLAASILTILILLFAGITAIYRWEYGLAIFLASLSLMNRLKTAYYVDFTYAIVTAESAFIFLLFLASQRRSAKSNIAEKVDPFLLTLIYLLIFAGCLSLFSSLDVRVSVRLLVSGVVEPIVLFYLVRSNLQSIRQVKLIVCALIVSAGISTGYGLWQIFFLEGYTGNPFDYRIVSVFYSPAIFGEVLLLSLPLVVVTRVSLQGSKRAVKLLLDSTVVCMIVALLTTITRSAWLGLLVSLAVLQFDYRIRRYLFGRMLMIFIVLMFLVVQSNIVPNWSGPLELFQRRPVSVKDFRDQTTSVGERLYAWQTALVMIVDNPMGVGLGTFKWVWPKFRPNSLPLDAAHQLFLDIGVEMGVLGMLAFICIAVYSIRISIHLFRASADHYVASLGLGILSCLAGYFAHALTGGAELVHNIRNVDDPLGSPIATGMLIFWTLVGCLCILKSSNEVRTTGRSAHG